MVLIYAYVGQTLEESDGTGEYEFTSVNILNLSFDFDL